MNARPFISVLISIDVTSEMVTLAVNQAMLYSRTE
jgi:hypothetical protein